MGYKRRKSRRNKNLLLFVLAVFFTLCTAALALKLPEQFKGYQASKEALAEVQAEKQANESQIAESKEKAADMEKQVEDLQGQLKKLQAENPKLHEALKGTEVKHAYLTFDDGPSENTVKILDFLKANNIKATFFVIGTKGNDELYKRIVDEGHTLGLHSDTHKYNEIYKSTEAFMNDITTLKNKMYDLTGVQSNILRFPGGSNNTISKRYNKADIMDKLVTKVKEQGYSYFDWNVDSSDASAACQDKNVIVQSVLNGARDKKNAIILMHDAGAKITTVQALPEIVTGLREEGYVFDRITEDTVPVQFK